MGWSWGTAVLCAALGVVLSSLWSVAACAADAPWQRLTGVLVESQILLPRFALFEHCGSVEWLTGAVGVRGQDTASSRRVRGAHLRG